ncbi:hypothetical protein O0I10_011947 [Lichtheimia ornata]|uniref:Uncharacterized protein n=1 Tax=Lichtheimia ornata TaxID=688661 RepID=A0AAD7URV8_9FUNG|nr:uncharacterized protein O0I10_011947 [Lichtheimia ornata]KAJ8652419.1 hypothetical protein O0I10_011947 [Lichtheimia ornata]
MWINILLPPVEDVLDEVAADRVVHEFKPSDHVAQLAARKCTPHFPSYLRYAYADVHEGCVFIREAAFVSDANRSYPLKPRESHRRRAIGENPHPDTCILVAISAGGLVAHKMKSMGSVTTSTEFAGFVQMVLKSIRSEATMFYGFDSAPAEIANAIEVRLQVVAMNRKAFFLRRS